MHLSPFAKAESIEIAAAAGLDVIGFDIREAAELFDDDGIDRVRELFADVAFSRQTLCPV